MKKTLTIAIGLGLAVTVPTAFASSSLSPGSSLSTLPTNTLPCAVGGSCYAATTSTTIVNSKNPLETASVNEMVYLGSGGYEFFYQFTNTTTGANPDTYDQVNMDLFSNYAVSVATDNCTSGTCVSPTASMPGGAVASRDGGAGGGINFFYQGSSGTDGTLGSGQSTVWLEVDTNATGYNNSGYAGVIDSGTATSVGPLYQPTGPTTVPEPVSMGLLGGGLALLGVMRLRKSKKA